VTPIKIPTKRSRVVYRIKVRGEDAAKAIPAGTEPKDSTDRPETIDLTVTASAPTRTGSGTGCRDGQNRSSSTRRGSSNPTTPVDRSTRGRRQATRRSLEEGGQARQYVHEKLTKKNFFDALGFRPAESPSPWKETARSMPACWRQWPAWKKKPSRVAVARLCGQPFQFRPHVDRGLRGWPLDPDRRHPARGWHWTRPTSSLLTSSFANDGPTRWGAFPLLGNGVGEDRDRGPRHRVRTGLIPSRGEHELFLVLFPFPAFEKEAFSGASSLRSLTRITKPHPEKPKDP